MPTYSYACTECDNRFDIVQSFTDDSLTVCPACSGKLRKLFNTVGIVFKGSGFYRNDSRGTSSTSESASSDSSSSSDSKSSTEKKSDSSKPSEKSSGSSEKKSTSTSASAGAS
ncbi:FmdB family transcriptional regulator [Rhodococcus sp. Leaf7]|uniref:FmdB family zinc ribbon protein n=1 Tax=unclassified Rhodococcus (in: high G+C Gram-positive bacteria) TaxID=192944 RepID=UPI0005AC31EB|nr:MULTISPECIES: FmdB family zinc ribbon protein [unclassified Rhodococcus (in: high G+C Gram-positive bacteria)]KIQ17067.1 FmdB family transcriptional regulator [Rhodococcus sp. MEB064]KQU06730.1 FmdB family transcriptional regulator [Rhodococcus sp. Leaf7]KQU42249.1 FmdB family transcriptional regulator [Rhodococcus sp. Leaf247]